jgi:alpha-tubulin suppressor-like RCC1 family protein
MKSALDSRLAFLKLLCIFGLAVLLWQAVATQAATTATNIAPGCVAEHSLFLKSDGSLWAMGSNVYGDLGDGTDYNETNRPEQIVAEGVTAIAAGLDGSFFIKSDGSLWAMGLNEYGELGDGTFGNGQLNDVNQPEQIVASGVKAIAAGAYHSLFLKSDGSLWAMGRNDMGQLLKSDGSLWAMGANDSGQLGDGTYSTNYPNGIDRPEQIVGDGVVAIAAGRGHSLFLKSGGSLWAMGSNFYGQLGDGTFGIFNATNRPEQIVPSGVTAIAAGRDHSLFLKSDGSLWGMGLDSEGELGDGFFGTNYCSSIPEQIVPSP